MPYSESIDERIRTVTSGWGDTASKKMFGGICHLIAGKMFCGVYRDYLILRLLKQQADTLIGSGAARPFDITGRPMKGWVMIEEKELVGDDVFRRLLEDARCFVISLPGK
jgi:TfoX/Sxy family transcriptional regulator of competence genes